MGFTLRFILGTVLVLSCSWSIQTTKLNRQIRQVHNEDSKQADKLQKIEVERSTQQSVVANLSEEHITKPKTDFSTEDNKTIDKQNSVVGKLQKSESYKKAASQPEIKTAREEIARSIDIEKYVSKEFHNKNNVYSLPISSDTEKYIEPGYEFRGTTHKHQDPEEEYDFDSVLTTPKSSLFDHKYKEAVESVNQKLEHIDNSHEASVEFESKENVNLEKLYEETKKNDTKADLNYINYKNIISNDTGSKNSLHKDLVVEAGTNFIFNSSYNHTTVIDENDNGNNTIVKDPEDEKKADTSTISNLIPVHGDLEKSESATIKSILLTTRKSIVLTKPPSNKNSSDISILSNNIETETVKAINIAPSNLLTTTEKSKTDQEIVSVVYAWSNLRTTTEKSKEDKETVSELSAFTHVLTTTEKSKGDKEIVSEVYTYKAPIDITKRGSIKFAQSTSTEPTVIANKINKKSEQLLQENQIIPVHIETPTSAVTTTTSASVDSTEKTIKMETPPNIVPSTIDSLVVTEFTTMRETTADAVELETKPKTDTPIEVTTKQVSTEVEATTLSPETEATTLLPEIKTTTLLPEIKATTLLPEIEATTLLPEIEITTLLSETEARTLSSKTEAETTISNHAVITTTSLSDEMVTETTTTLSEDVKTETENKPTTSPKYGNTEKSVNFETTILSTQTLPVEQETTTFTSTYLSDSTPTAITAEAITDESVITTSTEVITTVSAVNKFATNFSVTTENAVRTSKGLFKEATITTPATSATTLETSTLLPTTTEDLTTVTSEVISNTMPETATETVTYYEFTQTKIQEPETSTISITDSDSTNLLIPHLKQVTQAESTTELENVTDSSAITSDSSELNPPSDDNSGTIAAIAISSVGAVCLILLAGLLVIMRKRQKRFNYGQRCTPVSLDDYSMDNVSVFNSVRRKGMVRGSKRSYGNPAFEDPASVSHPLNFPALGKFANNFEDMKAEFEEIPQITARTNELPEGCDTKNRYANVIPLPETRVFLNLIDGYPNSDYINANYVTGPKNIKGYYIACQAPMQNTVDDFWRMIWEQQSKVILMLTHLFENGVEKCVDYLPPSEVLDCHRLFGDFQITLKKREVKDKYIISILQLKNMVSNSWREVTHFWYLGWPERGVPAEANSLIAFLIEARSYMKSASLDRKDTTANGNLTNGLTKNELNPVVVHCSPGTGRTGVMIACDIAIREFEQTRLVDVPRIVYKIRRDRASAVQTKEQYAFIYKVINLYATKLTGGALDSF